MTLISAKIFLIGLVVLAVPLFALGFLHWNGDHTRCQDGKSWRSDRWYTMVAVGKLELRYRNYNFDCRGMKYNPDVWKPL